MPPQNAAPDAAPANQINVRPGEEPPPEEGQPEQVKPEMLTGGKLYSLPSSDINKKRKSG